MSDLMQEASGSPPACRKERENVDSGREIREGWEETREGLELKGGEEEGKEGSMTDLPQGFLAAEKCFLHA